jgi:hypothetical protein
LLIEKKSDWSCFSQIGSEASPQKQRVFQSKVEEYDNQDSTKGDGGDQSESLGFLLMSGQEKTRSYSSKEAHKKLEEKNFDPGVLSDNRRFRISNITESIPEISEHDDSSSLVGDELNSKILNIKPMDKLE